MVSKSMAGSGTDACVGFILGYVLFLLIFTILNYLPFLLTLLLQQSLLIHTRLSLSEWLTDKVVRQKF